MQILALSLLCSRHTHSPIRNHDWQWAIRRGDGGTDRQTEGDEEYERGKCKVRKAKIKVKGQRIYSSFPILPKQEMNLTA